MLGVVELGLSLPSLPCQRSTLSPGAGRACPPAPPPLQLSRDPIWVHESLLPLWLIKGYEDVEGVKLRDTEQMSD